MRIVRLEASNVKRLKAVRITPEGDLIVIGGDNAQGKSSVLDSIWFALGGGRAQGDTPEVIRQGQDEAHVTLDLGEFLVTRSWLEGKSSLKVVAADGARYASPQRLLDSLVGDLSFDPLGFANQPAQAQRDTLLGLVKLDFDLDALDRARATHYAERTEVGRQGKQHEGALRELPVPPADTPDELVDVEELRNSARDARLIMQAYRDLEARYTAAELARDEARDALARANQTLKDLGRRLDATDEPRDPDDFVSALSEVTKTNEAVQLKRRRALQERLITERRSQYTELTTEIADLDRRKSDGLADAKFPVEGLSFLEYGVAYNGVPFSQCSGAEKLRVSVAIAMALNPTLRVLRITDGSLLDSKNMALLATLAEEHDFQVFVERVGDGDPAAIIIEDGEVRS